MKQWGRYSWSLFVISAGLLVASCNNSDATSSAVLTTNAPPPTATGPIVPKLSGNVPTEVTGASPTKTPEENRPFFDQFSWQSFIALCWPANTSKRGVPANPNDPAMLLTMKNTTPIVWVSYKNQWDLFAQGNNRPSPWNSFDDPINPCPSAHSMTHVFGLAKGATLPNGKGLTGDIDEAFSVPLVDQQKNYALYEIRYNQPQYDFIRGSDSDPTTWIYLKKNLMTQEMKGGGTVTMPISNTTTPGAMLIKAAWKVITAVDDPSRYYIIDEPVFDPVSGKCIKMKLGLVGLHIAQKVDGFSEWIWSSFEQVDNVPGAPNARAPYSFNNGTSTPKTDRGYANKPTGTGALPVSQRVPVQVTRFNPIPTTPKGLSTVDLNALYQKAVGNAWLKYYELVITQWPTDDTSFKLYGSGGGIYPKDCGAAFPVDGCANTSMETYFQSKLDASTFGNSCMSCHYQAPGTDFSWSLQNRSH
ncbi:MAG: hypothetical protein JST51_19105 [Armatimonadetes bacterium]|nr:hypothetical protein [Armatimonadota bacterium]